MVEMISRFRVRAAACGALRPRINASLCRAEFSKARGHGVNQPGPSFSSCSGRGVSLPRKIPPKAKKGHYLLMPVGFMGGREAGQGSAGGERAGGDGRRGGGELSRQRCG